MFCKPKVWDVDYNSNMLRFCTNVKKAELGILYIGRRLRNYFLRKTMVGPTLEWPSVNIYYFDRESVLKADDGRMEVHLKPFYGGFLSKNYEGICYVRCVRLGSAGTIFSKLLHVAPICCLSMKVKPKHSIVSDDGIVLRLKGGEILEGSLCTESKVKVEICRINEYMHLNFSETILEADCGHHEFSWTPSAVNDGTVIFGDISGKEIVKTFGMTGNPYVLSDVTHASNRISLRIRMGWRKEINVPIEVQP